MTSPFERIYTHVIEQAPQLAPKNTYIIHEWLATGYDVEKDIIPAINEACKRGTKSIYSFGYFTPFIKTVNEKKIKEASKPKEYSQQEKDALRAKNIQWHKDRGLHTMQIGPQDYDWLEKWKSKQDSSCKENINGA